MRSAVVAGRDGHCGSEIGSCASGGGLVCLPVVPALPASLLLPGLAGGLAAAVAGATPVRTIRH